MPLGGGEEGVAMVLPEGAAPPAPGSEEYRAAARRRDAWAGLAGLRRRDAMARFVAEVEAGVPSWEARAGEVHTPVA